MGETNFCTPTLPKSLNQFGWRFEYITKSTQGLDEQNSRGNQFGRYESVQIKNHIFSVFFWLKYPSIYLSTTIYLSIYPIFSWGCRSHFWDFFNA